MKSRTKHITDVSEKCEVTDLFARINTFNVETYIILIQLVKCLKSITYPTSNISIYNETLRDGTRKAQIFLDMAGTCNSTIIVLLSVNKDKTANIEHLV